MYFFDKQISELVQISTNLLKRYKNHWTQSSRSVPVLSAETLMSMKEQHKEQKEWENLVIPKSLAVQWPWRDWLSQMQYI